MGLKDILQVCSAILVSLGGAGAIVFGFSSYLGKRWADRALQDQQQRYAQLNLQLQSHLDVTTRILQVELNTLGHLQKLRTEESVSRIAGLWKRMATLNNWFGMFASGGLQLVPSNDDARQKHEEKIRALFNEALNEAQKYLVEEGLFVPKAIVDIAQEALTATQREKFNLANFSPFFSSNPEMYQHYFKNREEHFKLFSEKMVEFQKLVRGYLQVDLTASREQSA